MKHITFNVNLITSLHLWTHLPVSSFVFIVYIYISSYPVSIHVMALVD